MLIVGLTGNIASGKSTVAAALVSRGATLIDSDVAARAAVAPGTLVLAAITRRFGGDILQADGTIDRARLGQRVFADVDARHALERIVHPAVVHNNDLRVVIRAARAQQNSGPSGHTLAQSIVFQWSPDLPTKDAAIKNEYTIVKKIYEALKQGLPARAVTVEEVEAPIYKDLHFGRDLCTTSCPFSF